jgi:pilus assembly protein CpaC
MRRNRRLVYIFLAAMLAAPAAAARADQLVRLAEAIHPAIAPDKPSPSAPVPVQTPAPAAPGKLIVTVGMSITIDSPLKIQRVYYGDGNLVDAVAIDPNQVLITGKAPGATNLMIWQQGGSRLIYELTVRPSPFRLEAVRQQIARDFPAADINVTFDNDTVFVRGTVKDLASADRIMMIAATLGGKTVNLLRIEVPAEEPQILLKVRFADVDRSVSQSLGVNLASAAFNQTTALGTGTPISTTGTPPLTLSSVVNILLSRPDINLSAAIQALESKNLLEILAEPNVLAINGKPASFLAGGEYPYPMIQPSTGAATITVAFKEYGIRLNFLPTITPRGTIRLQVAPEVSSLDFANSVTIDGYTIPGLTTRRVSTEIELESGQSFMIAGLLDKQVQETYSKVPGIGSIPILGKLFQTKQVTKNDSELMVIITPELVRPVPAGAAVPELNYPRPFMPPNSNTPIRQPGIQTTGPVPVHPPADSVPYEQLILQKQKEGQQSPLPSGQEPAGPQGANPLVGSPAPGPVPGGTGH